jgi:hypothetical protein
VQACCGVAHTVDGDASPILLADRAHALPVSDPAGSIQTFAARPLTFHEYDVDAVSEPEVAVTVKVCEPGAMPAYDAGEVHGAGVAPSIEQASAVAFVAAKEKAAELDEVVDAGPERMLTVGGIATVHEYDALVESEPDVAVTVKT